MVAHKLQGRAQIQGLDISIENAKGSIRRWYDPHGKEKGHTKMHHAYGYIRRTKGTDGDHVDVYVGPNPEADTVFIVNQMKKPEDDEPGKAWTKFDEQKCMIGWDSMEDAKAAYLKQYDDPRFFGSIKAMSMDEFQAKVLHKENHGKKVAEEHMPFKSKAQQRAAFGGYIPGFSKERAHEWADETPNIKKLPEHVKKSLDTIGTRFVELNIGRVGSELALLDTGMKLAKMHVLPDGSGFFTATVGKKEKKALLGGHSEIGDDMPAQTPFAEAIKHDPIKKADAERANKLEHWVDNAGLATLAAPAAGHLIGAGLQKIPNARAQALGHSIEGVAKRVSGSMKEHALEVGGLALVSPTVTRGIAKRLDKALPEKTSAVATYEQLRRGALGLDQADARPARAISEEIHRERRAALEKVASKYLPGFEYMSEAEKVAIMPLLANMAGRAVGGGKALAKAVAGEGGALAGQLGHMAQGARLQGAELLHEGRRAVRGAVENVGDLAAAHRAGVGAQFQAGLKGTALSPEALQHAQLGAMGARAEQRGLAGIDSAIHRGQAGGVQVVSPGATPVPVPAKAAPAPSAAPAAADELRTARGKPGTRQPAQEAGTRAEGAKRPAAAPASPQGGLPSIPSVLAPPDAQGRVLHGPGRPAAPPSPVAASLPGWSGAAPAGQVQRKSLARRLLPAAAIGGAAMGLGGAGLAAGSGLAHLQSAGQNAKPIAADPYQGPNRVF